MMPKPPKVQQKVETPPSAAQALFADTNDEIHRVRDLLTRRVLGSARVIRLYGTDYTRPEGGWKNENGYPVAAWVEVETPGPVGSTVLVDGVALPADMPGGRSQRVALDPNEVLPVVLSSAALVVRLVVITPTRPSR
jgi:hypothetical protein